MIRTSLRIDRREGLGMLPSRRSFMGCGHMAVLFAVAALVDAEAVASAPDDDDLDEVVVQPQITMSESQFEQYLGATRNVELPNGRVVTSNAPNFRLESSLAEEIRVLTKACSLTESQKKKLQLAGRGDIDRLVGEVAEMRRKCVGIPMNIQQYTEMRNILQVLNNKIQLGVIHESSLFYKTLRKTLDVQQRYSYQLFVHERKVAVVKQVLSTWTRLTNGIKLSTESQQKLLDTLVAHGRIPQTHTSYNMYIVLIETARLESHLIPLLSEEEWQSIQTYLQRSRASIEIMKKSGLWSPPEDDDEQVSDLGKE